MFQDSLSRRHASQASSCTTVLNPLTTSLLPAASNPGAGSSSSSTALVAAVAAVAAVQRSSNSGRALQGPEGSSSSGAAAGPRASVAAVAAHGAVAAAAAVAGAVAAVAAAVGGAAEDGLGRAARATRQRASGNKWQALGDEDRGLDLPLSPLPGTWQWLQQASGGWQWQ